MAIKFDAKKKKASIPMLSKLVRVIFIDSRPTHMFRRIELLGMMNAPSPIFTTKNAKLSFRFDELKHPLKGVACDVCESGCNFVFPFLTDEEAKDKNGKPLSLDIIAMLFKKYHPNLKETFHG